MTTESESAPQANLSIDQMRAMVEQHDAKVLGDALAPIQELLASPTYTEALRKLTTLYNQVGNAKPFGPFLKASVTGLTGLQTIMETELRALDRRRQVLAEMAGQTGQPVPTSDAS